MLGAIGFGWLFSRHILYPALHVPDSAPVILRPILGFLMAWYLVRRQAERWSSYGLRRPDSMLAFAGWTALVVLLLWVSGTYLAPVLASVLSFEPRPDFFGYVHGNTLAFAGWVAISWLVGGFCEELLFRGFLLSRIRSMFRSPLVGMATGTHGPSFAVRRASCLSGSLRYRVRDNHRRNLGRRLSSEWSESLAVNRGARSLGQLRDVRTLPVSAASIERPRKAR